MLYIIMSLQTLVCSDCMLYIQKMMVQTLHQGSARRKTGIIMMSQLSTVKTIECVLLLEYLLMLLNFSSYLLLNVLKTNFQSSAAVFD